MEKDAIIQDSLNKKSHTSEDIKKISELFSILIEIDRKIKCRQTAGKNPKKRKVVKNYENKGVWKTSKSRTGLSNHY